MAVYAVPTNRTPVARKKISMKRKMTPELRARREYLRTHTVDIYTDETGKVVAIAREKKVGE